MSTYLWAHNRHTFSIASLSFFKTRYGSLIEDNTLSMAAILIGELSELWWLATGGNSNTSRCRHSASFGSTMSKALQRQENEDCIKHRIFIFTLRKKVQIVRRHIIGTEILLAFKCIWAHIIPWLKSTRPTVYCMQGCERPLSKKEENNNKCSKSLWNWGKTQKMAWIHKKRHLFYGFKKEGKRGNQLKKETLTSVYGKTIVDIGAWLHSQVTIKATAK